MANQDGYVDILVEDMRLDDPELKSFDGKGGSARLPPGTYTFEVAEVKRDKSKKQNPMIVVDYKVVSDGEFEGETMRAYYTLDPEQKVSRARLLHVVKALGVPLMENGAFSLLSWHGLRMEAEVEHETQEGTYDPVRNINVPGKTFGRIVSEREAPQLGAPATKGAAAQAPATGQPSRRPVGNANGTRQTSR